ncbi:MAG: hypothetical protein J0I77_01850 [Rudaea sp.]|uniref:hypothetical protein n=1 Tax=unclassified Rudaea TaxID=2627037 RepID=UPI0010F91B6E|nr:MULTISPECIES: hypothetical protein [unclassified Rudaea]MBN8884438.1 hypothetical protein [Rudaea sp.]
MLTTGSSLIHLAAMRRSPAQIARALALGDDPNREDSLGRTPLHCLLAPVSAVKNFDQHDVVRESVALLVAAGADIERMNIFGRAASSEFHRLAQQGWSDLLPQAAPAALRPRPRM